LRLSDYFYYDETSPTFLRWKVERRTGKDHNRVVCSPGDVAGTMSSKYYAMVSLDNKRLYCHRVIWALFNSCSLDDIPDVDHKDGDKKNNKYTNLKAKPHAQNMRNNFKRSDGTDVVGVRRHCIKRKDGSTDFYWVAKWCELDGRDTGRLFNIAKYGEDAALNLAIKARQDAITRLNAEGAGYTERHGKDTK